MTDLQAFNSLVRFLAGKEAAEQAGIRRQENLVAGWVVFGCLVLAGALVLFLVLGR